MVPSSHCVVLTSHVIVLLSHSMVHLFFLTFDSTILTLCSSNITCDYTFVIFGGFFIYFFLTFDGTILTLCSINITCNCTFVTFSDSFIFFSQFMVPFLHCTVPLSHVLYFCHIRWFLFFFFFFSHI